MKVRFYLVVVGVSLVALTGCSDDVSSGTTASQSLSTTSSLTASAVETVSAYWEAMSADDMDSVQDLLDDRAGGLFNLSAFLVALEPGKISHRCELVEGSNSREVTCTLKFDSPFVPVFTQMGGDDEGIPMSTVTVSDSRVADVTVPPVIERSSVAIYEWASDRGDDGISVACDPASYGPGDVRTIGDAIAAHPECSRALLSLADEYQTDVVRKLLASIGSNDMTVIASVVRAPEWTPYNTDQLRNALRFATTFGWVGDVEECTRGTGQISDHLVAEITCVVESYHPVIDPGASVDWTFSMKGGFVVTTDPAPHAELADGGRRLYEWAIENSPGSTTLACDPDERDPFEVVVDLTPYALHPSCGSHLASLVGDFFADTDPDHPVTVLVRLAETFEEGDLDSHMRYFADDAKFDNYRGKDEIREFIAPNIGDYSFEFSDFRVIGGSLCATYRSGSLVRIDRAAISDGQVIEYDRTPEGAAECRE